MHSAMINTIQPKAVYSSWDPTKNSSLESLIDGPIKESNLKLHISRLIIISVRSLSSVVILVPTDQEVLGSIPDSALKVSSSGEVFHSIYVWWVFHCPLYIFCLILSSYGSPQFCRQTVREDLQLYSCSYMWSKESSKSSDNLICGIKGGLSRINSVVCYY